MILLSPESLLLQNKTTFKSIWQREKVSVLSVILQAITETLWDMVMHTCNLET